MSRRLTFAGIAGARLCPSSLLVVACASAILNSGCDAKKDARDFEIGVCHASNPGGIREAADSGAGSIRNTLTWRTLQPGADELRFPEPYRAIVASADRAGLRLLTPIGYGNPLFEDGGYPRSAEAVQAFARSAKYAALAMHRTNPIFEIWNEWNLGIGMGARGPGDPESYVQLQREACAAIKAVRPELTVLAGSMAGAGLTGDWLLRACEAGMLDHADGISFHPYTFWMDGREVMPERGMQWLVTEAKAIIDRFPGGKEMPLYITEIGWPTFDGKEGVTLEEQAQFAARALLLLRAEERIRGVWWFNLRDKDSGSSNFNHHFGLLYDDGTAKPSFHAFRDVAALLRDARRVWKESLGDGMHAVWIEEQDRTRAVALWMARPGAGGTVTLAVESRSGAEIQLVGTGEWREMAPGKGSLSASFGNMPVVVRGLDTSARILESEQLPMRQRAVR